MSLHFPASSSLMGSYLSHSAVSQSMFLSATKATKQSWWFDPHTFSLRMFPCCLVRLFHSVPTKWRLGFVETKKKRKKKWIQQFWLFYIYFICIFTWLLASVFFFSLDVVGSINLLGWLLWKHLLECLYPTGKEWYPQVKED